MDSLDHSEKLPQNLSIKIQTMFGNNFQQSFVLVMISFWNLPSINYDIKRHLQSHLQEMIESPGDDRVLMRRKNDLSPNCFETVNMSLPVLFVSTL